MTTFAFIFVKYFLHCAVSDPFFLRPKVKVWSSWPVSSYNCGMSSTFQGLLRTNNFQAFLGYFLCGGICFHHRMAISLKGIWHKVFYHCGFSFFIITQIISKEIISLNMASIFYMTSCKLTDSRYEYLSKLKPNSKTCSLENQRFWAEGLVKKNHSYKSNLVTAL